MSKEKYFAEMENILENISLKCCHFMLNGLLSEDVDTRMAYALYFSRHSPRLNGVMKIYVFCFCISFQVTQSHLILSNLSHLDILANAHP